MTPKNADLKPEPSRHEALLSGDLASPTGFEIAPYVVSLLIFFIIALLPCAFATWNAYRVMSKWGMLPNFTEARTLPDGRPMLERPEHHHWSFEARLGMRRLSPNEVFASLQETVPAMLLLWVSLHLSDFIISALFPNHRP